MRIRFVKSFVAALALCAALPPLAHGHHGVPQDSSAATAPMPLDLNSTYSGIGSLSFDCENGMAGPYPCKNVDLAGFLPLPVLGGPAGNDIWGWTDRKQGREYAIMGTTTSTGFADVTDPSDPVLVGLLPTRGIPDNILWRDIKVDGHYAFVVSELTNSGMQVFDLRRLRRADPGQGLPKTFTPDAVYDEISNTHNISINERTDTAYAVGTDTCEINDEAGGLHMIDISKPTRPRFAGCALNRHTSEDGEEPDNYVHDVECVVYRGPDRDYRGHEICFSSNENVVTIYDVTKRKRPKVISNTAYPSAAYTHQGSLTRGQRFFLFGDELDEQENGQPTTTYILDVKDLDSPPVPKPYYHESASIDHNLYVHGRRVFESNYAEGLRILEYSNRSLKRGKLKERAFFDVVPGVDVAEFAGTWSNYRFPSGTVVSSAIENTVNGLFVLRPDLPKVKGGGKSCKKRKRKNCKRH